MRTYGLTIVYCVVVMQALFLWPWAAPPASAQTATPEPAPVILDEALAAAGVTRSELTISEPWEDGYITAGRLPALVDTLVNPLYLPSFMQVFGARFSGARDTVSPHVLFNNAFEMLNIDTRTFQAAEYESMSLVDALEHLQASHHRGLIEPAYRSELAANIELWPVELQEAMTLLVQAFTRASLERQAAVSELSREELETLSKAMTTMLTRADLDDGNIFLTGLDAEWPVDLQIVRKLDFQRLFYAASILSEAIEMTRTRLQASREKLGPVDHETLLLEFHSAAGTICVGGPGINRYSEETALLVDLGGNDVYRNNAGGGTNAFDGISCLIDMDGNDLYENTGSGALGTGICGVGILIDYDGNDVYRSGSGSQGAGLCGVGMLYDESGHDTWIADTFTQGAAMFGIGIAVDVGGNDSFVCRSIGQGFGSTLGIGLLVNVNGSDSYVAGPAWDDPRQRDMDCSIFTQGAAAGFRAPDTLRTASLYGGIGFLVDGKGNDRYVAGNFSQGAARFGAMGLFLDGEGDDIVFGGSHCQGTAMAWSTACMVDQFGNDRYTAGDSSQGAAIDHSAGFMLDYAGDDFRSLRGEHGQGYARETSSFGLFMDYRGYDTYTGGPYARGYAQPYFTEPDYPVAIFIDHRGKDVYPQGAGNNREWTWHHYRGGVGIDTPNEPSMYFASERALSRHLHYDMSPVTDLETGVNTSQLGSGDPFASFHALAGVIKKGESALPVIVKAMQRGHDPFRRNMEEGLGLILMNHPEHSQWKQELMPLTENLDPRTRQWAAIQLARDLRADLAPTFRKLLEDPEAAVRREAARALGHLRDTDAETPLSQMALNDPDPGNRKEALRALGQCDAGNTMEIFREALNDPSLPVHLEAKRWVEKERDTKSVGSLQLLASSDNPMIRLSAAETLIKLGVKSGFPVLIDALETVPHNPSTHDGGLRLPTFLAEYSGHNFGWDIETWRQWWIEAEAGFDLDKAIRARNDYLKVHYDISRMSPGVLLRKLNQLRAWYPDYMGLDRKLAPWVRVKAKIALDQNAIRTAEKLGEYTVAMAPDDPESWSVLSEIRYARKNFQGAHDAIIQALEMDPQNTQYRRLREIYRKALPTSEDS